MHPTIPTHTLVIGTHPSDQSFKKTEYYGHFCNAFWYTVGEAFGFRRDVGEITPRVTDRADSYGRIVLLPGALQLPVITYDRQVTILLEKGFALWDVLQQCKRPGSLDKSIDRNAPILHADIKGLVNKTPSIKRICFTSGVSSFTMFCRLKSNKDWLKQDGAFRCDPKDWRTIKQFEKGPKWQKRIAKETSKDAIVVCCLPSCSSANAIVSYSDKRTEWLELCWRPSLYL